jgi:hypothetical protein
MRRAADPARISLGHSAAFDIFVEGLEFAGREDFTLQLSAKRKR